jgi:ABC-type uncharacterized transport system permease subunit
METSHTDERQRCAGKRGERGQTTLDFAIGVSVFLAVLLFIFLFIPGILSPFTASAQDETVSSNRAADQLAMGMLASPSDPYVLDSYCTVVFFENTSGDCSFTNETLESQLHVETSYQRLNVSLRGNRTSSGAEFMCWDGSGNQTGLVASSNDACDTTFTRGDPVPTSQPSVTSVRVVSIDGQDVTLFVEMW